MDEFHDSWGRKAVKREGWGGLGTALLVFLYLVVIVFGILAGMFASHYGYEAVEWLLT